MKSFITNFFYYVEMISHSKPWITREDQRAVAQQLKSGMLARGLKVREFEDAISKYMGTLGTVTAGSGTSALMFGLRILDVGPGDEAILPTYVCHSVLDAVRQVGAAPVFCDVEKNWNMTVETAAPLVSSKTKVIIVVHIFGNAADTTSFMQLGLPIIEDCCQAFGAKTNGKMVGNIGSFGAFSFHATKCMTTGEGGALTTNDPILLERMKSLATDNKSLSPMSDLQAVLGLSQISRYDVMVARRHEIANRYFQEFEDLEIIASRNNARSSIYFRYPVKFQNYNFEDLQEAYYKRGIHVRRGVDKLLHREMNLLDKKFPEAARLFQQTLSIPIYPSLTEPEQQKIIESTKDIFCKKCI
ncbi:MAG: DegT/DnrJ/EryC1/StrS family aminotransferase [Deltaproteobacteria bacterium]|nr:DegT/DnrJ/EryC1/StrS family aminotransferase [Deltaproteobacteria bacterium]